MLRLFVVTTLGLSAMIRMASAASSVTLNPTQDAFVSSLNSTSNYGAGGAILVNAAGLPKGEFDSLLKFDLSSAKSTFDATFGAGLWSIQSITLQLSSSNPNNGLFNSPAATGSFTLTWLQSDSWTEGTGTPAIPTTDGVTYATLPSFRSGADQLVGTFNFPGGTSGNNTYSLNTSASSFLSDATAGHLVSLLALPNDAAIVYTANSENFTTAANRPVLTVTAVPEPASVGLLGLGALGMIASRRRSLCLSV